MGIGLWGWVVMVVFVFTLSACSMYKNIPVDNSYTVGCDAKVNNNGEIYCIIVMEVCRGK